MRLVYLAIAWVVGISFARALPAIDSHVWLICLVVCLALLLALRRDRWALLLLALTVAAAGGWRQSSLPSTSEIAAYNGSAVTITGDVIAEPALRGNRILLRVAAETIFVNNHKQTTDGLVLIETDRSQAASYGNRIRATGALNTPATWDRFSYADYLARQGIFSHMGNAAVEVISAGHGDPVFRLLIDLRNRVKREIAVALPEPQAGLLIGMLTGDESSISPELAEAFSRTGASHVIAISGFNMVIVSTIVFRMIAALFGDEKSLSAFFAVALILLYTVFVGASAGVVRAAIMSSLVIIASLQRRPVWRPATLAFATLVMVSHPSVLLDLSFQLSFCAVLGLTLFADPMSLRLKQLLRRILPEGLARAAHGFLAEPVTATLAAQITTLPLILLYFGRLSLVALPVNLLILPIQTILLVLGLAAAAVAVFVPALGTLLLWADMPCLSWTIAVVRAFADWEFAELVVDIDGRLIQAFYVLLIAGAVMRAANPRRFSKAWAMLRRQSAVLALSTSAAIALALMLAMLLSRGGDGRLHVWLLDVGHSNAVLLQTPTGAHILVDGGRYPTRLLTAMGDRLPFYDREIELLAITHPDELDIAALNTLLERYSIGAAIYHGQQNDGEVFTQIMTKLQDSGTPIERVRAGYTIQLSDGAAIEVLHPQERPSIVDRLHDVALVLRVSYGDISLLLTSDLSVSGQREMLSHGISPQATVLQLPQHGGRDSLDNRRPSLDAEFLHWTLPSLALLQSDAGNRYGDPDPDTLNMIKMLDVPLRRTDEGGTIHLSTDGAELRVHN